MLLSKSCVYALRASLYVATVSNGSYVSLNQISDKLDLSYHFITKIFQELTRKGLMESMKGPNGGVRLKQPSGEVFLVEIVAAIDGMDLLTECALGLPGCGIAKPCPLHDQWAEARDGIRIMLEKTSLENLVEKGKAGNLRITAEGGFDWG
jgi:Rrf2 family transcriptional regulator, iron-sulfur cluster assembly transcription factor